VTSVSLPNQLWWKINMTTFLFVHGAFQGGWVWGRVAHALRKEGHEVHTPTLSGCGYLAHGGSQGFDLCDYLSDIVKYIEFEDLREIILVGHSFSGMICGAVMMEMPDRIRHAVFVDAIIPESHRSFVDLAGEAFWSMLDKNRQEDGTVTPWPLKVFGVSGPEAQWFEARLRPFPYKVFHSPFPGDFDPHRVSTSMISCQETMSPFIQAMALKAKGYNWPVLTIRSGHCPMVTCPAELARKILEQVASASA
jgi:pimeloyl-ACP methyl ester carboxylesterase